MVPFIDTKVYYSMPKEIAHISLAKAVFHHLPETALFHGSIKNHFNLFLYGAVVPDAFYYYLVGPHSSFIQSQSKKFHTDDATSLIYVLDFLNRFPDKNSKTLAFAAGVCCHIITDTVFHPMVYYFCGMEGLHLGATARHRAFETALDLYFWHNNKDKEAVSLGPILNHLDLSKQQLIHYFELLLNLETGQWQRYLHVALISHQYSHQLFQNIKIYKIINGLCQNRLGIHSKYESLFYPISKPQSLSFFNHNLYYRDPITNKLSVQSINDLTQKVIQQTTVLLSLLETSLISDHDVHQIIDQPSLPKIQPCLSKHYFKFWYNQTDLKKKLYKELNR